MGNLASTQLSTQSDPALVQRQILADREKQLAAISNPQQQLAARLGGLLGGGVTNVVQGRGFFDVSDPLLTKVTQIQGIYNEVASRVDPTSDPARFYSELQSAYSNAGLGREALAAAQEAQKAKGSALDLQLKETQVLEKNPELIAGRIEDALKSGKDAEAMRLANLSTRLQEDRDLSIEAKKTAIEKDKAYMSYQRALAEQGKYSIQAVNKDNPLDGFYRINQKTGEITVVPVPDEIAAKYNTPAKDNKGKPEGKLDKSKYMVGGDTTTTAATSTATPVQTTWSGVPIQAKPATPLSAIQERDFAIQRAYPTIPVSSLTEEAKAQLAQQMGL